MEKFDIFKHIAERTGGDIYIGVVGPVRTGKSTFISRFMDLVIVPNIKDNYEKDRTRDELPQSGAGRTITTTEPKFVPSEAVHITIGEDMSAAVRMVDCVGYAVTGALGYVEDDVPRMVRTPWFEEEISFQRAAEIGTQKVIQEHSTIGLVITTDGSITDIPRESYVDSERRVISELKELGKPFIVVLNSTKPDAEETKALSTRLSQDYNTPVVPIDCLKMDTEQIYGVLTSVLYEFPVQQISVSLPDWIMELDDNNELKKSFTEGIFKAIEPIYSVRDVRQSVEMMKSIENTENVSLKTIDPGSGIICVDLDVSKSLFYNVLSEMSSMEVSSDKDIIRMMSELSYAKQEYDKVKDALEDVKTKGYGIVMPVRDDISFEEPDLIQHGNRFGVKLTATAPSIHMIRADIKTEVTPLVGTDKQGEEFARKITLEYEEDPSRLWETEFLGRSMQDLIKDGLESKLAHVPDNTRDKLKETIQKIVNDGSGGLICIIL